MMGGIYYLSLTTFNIFNNRDHVKIIPLLCVLIHDLTCDRHTQTLQLSLQLCGVQCRCRGLTLICSLPVYTGRWGELYIRYTAPMMKCHSRKRQTLERF